MKLIITFILFCQIGLSQVKVDSSIISKINNSIIKLKNINSTKVDLYETYFTHYKIQLRDKTISIKQFNNLIDGLNDLINIEIKKN